jgi:hypothetical protein
MMDRRLSRIERCLGGEPRHQVSICEEHEWPPSAWAELLTADAASDLERVADLAERYAGVRPVFGGPDTAIIICHSGPPRGELAPVKNAERILVNEPALPAWTHATADSPRASYGRRDENPVSNAMTLGK